MSGKRKLQSLLPVKRIDFTGLVEKWRDFGSLRAPMQESRKKGKEDPNSVPSSNCQIQGLVRGSVKLLHVSPCSTE